MKKEENITISSEDEELVDDLLEKFIKERYCHEPK